LRGAQRRSNPDEAIHENNNSHIDTARSIKPTEKQENISI
jgi:hypothetical protein